MHHSFLTDKIERLKKENSQLDLIESYLNKRTFLWLVLQESNQKWTDKACKIYIDMDAIWYSLNKNSLRDLNKKLLQR